VKIVKSRRWSRCKVLKVGGDRRCEDLEDCGVVKAVKV